MDSKEILLKEKISNFENTQILQVQYKKAIEFIKSHEGFSPVKYYCAAGMPTIGYGHLIQKNEKISVVISRAEADLLVRRDFDKALGFTDKTLPFLDGAQRIAVAHFIFSLGIGRFNKSDLKRAIINNEKLDSIWLSYCFYRTSNGKKIKSDYAFKIREWELELYNTNLR